MGRIATVSAANVPLGPSEETFPPPKKVGEGECRGRGAWQATCDSRASDALTRNVDIANLGSAGASGQNLVVLGGSVRIPTKWNVSFGLLYEGPISANEGVHDQRFSFMATWEL